MKYYNLTNEPRQRFNIDIGTETTTIELRWMPAGRLWLVDIMRPDGGVDIRGVGLQLYVAIFKQYGIPELIFFNTEGEISRDLTETTLCVMNRDEAAKYTVFAPANRGYGND